VRSDCCTAIFAERVPVRRFICALFCCIGLSIYATPANADYFTDIVAAGASARQGHYVEAIRRLSTALSVASLDPGVRSSLLSVRASMRYQNAEPALALFDFNDAIALTPDKGSLYWSRGIAYQSMGFLDRAMADFGTALRLEPYQTGVYTSRASIIWHATTSILRFKTSIAQSPPSRTPQSMSPR
jgi:lipoprotein NlpI